MFVKWAKVKAERAPVLPFRNLGGGQSLLKGMTREPQRSLSLDDELTQPRKRQG